MELNIILVSIIIFWLLLYKLFQLHLKIHKLNRLIKLIWNDKKRIRDIWHKSICKNCREGIDDYNSYDEYMLYEVCWKCKKNRIAFDIGLYPTCIDCYNYENNNFTSKYFEENGYSVFEI